MGTKSRDSARLIERTRELPCSCGLTARVHVARESVEHPTPWCEAFRRMSEADYIAHALAYLFAHSTGGLH